MAELRIESHPAAVAKDIHSKEPAAPGPLKALCTRYGIALQQIAADINVPTTTLLYYWQDKRWDPRRKTIPDDKVTWGAAVREALIARRVPPEEAYQLFGLHHDSGQRAILDAINELKRLFKRSEGRLERIEHAVGVNTPPDDDPAP